MAFNRERLGAARIRRILKTAGRQRYTELRLIPPPGFEALQVVTFAVPGSSAAIRRANTTFGHRLRSPPVAGGWFECVGQNLDRWGVDDHDRLELKPLVFSRRFISVSERWSGRCGLARRTSAYRVLTYDLTRGRYLSLDLWFERSAFNRYGSIEPAFRRFLLRHARKTSASCKRRMAKSPEWTVALTEQGMMFVAGGEGFPLRCAQHVVLSYRQLAPWISNAGERSLGTLLQGQIASP